MKKLPTIITALTLCLCLNAQDTTSISYSSTTYSIGYGGSKGIVYPITQGLTINDSLVAHFLFEGNANDNSGNGFDGTITGAVSDTNRFGEPGKALNFSNQDYVNVTITGGSKIDINTEELSIVTWIKIDSFPSPDNPMPIAGRLNNDASYNFPFWHWASVVWSGQWPRSWIQTSDGLTTTSDPGANLTTDTWYNVITVYDGSEVCTYLNGSQFGNCAAQIGAISTSGESFRIGASGGAPEHWFRGTIDEVRIYNRALISQEITDFSNN